MQTFGLNWPDYSIELTDLGEWDEPPGESRLKPFAAGEEPDLAEIMRTAPLESHWPRYVSA